MRQVLFVPFLGCLFVFHSAIFAASLFDTKIGHSVGIVIVDMQPKFFAEIPEVIAAKNELVRQQLSLLRWAKENGHPVLVFEYKDFGDTDIQLKDVLKTFPDGTVKFLTKNGPDGFSFVVTGQESPEKILRSWGVEKLIFSGVHTLKCVHQTMLSAQRLGFQVISSRDLIGDFDIDSVANPNIVYPYPSFLPESNKPEHRGHPLRLHSQFAPDISSCEHYLGRR